MNLPSCIFCDGPLDNETSGEHILLNALGGRKTTTRVVCSVCNNNFGSRIDKVLAQQVSAIRNLLQIRSGDGKLPPGLRNIEAGDYRIDVKGNGRVDIIGQPFTISRAPDGITTVNITARSPNHIEEISSHLASALKVPEACVRERILTAEFSMIRRPVGRVFIPLQLGGIDAARSAAKACIILWTLLTGSAETKSAVYNPVRKLICTQDEEIYTNLVSIDLRCLDCASMIQNKYGEFFNLIYLRSNDRGRVIGHFTLLNLLAFRIVLADKGGAPNQRIALVSNPLDPVVWSDEAAEEVEIPFSWLDAPLEVGDLEHVKLRLAEVIRRHRIVQFPKEIECICGDVFAKYSLDEEQEIPPHLTNKIIDELSLRIASYYLGVPYEEKFTYAQMRDRF